MRNKKEKSYMYGFLTIDNVVEAGGIERACRNSVYCPFCGGVKDNNLYHLIDERPIMCWECWRLFKVLTDEDRSICVSSIEY